MANKYGAKGFWQNDIYWASLWEYKVFSELKSNFPDMEINRQVKVLLKPKTDRFPPIFWKCDFHTSCKNGYPNLFIEAKGVRTKEFIRDMKYLDFMAPMTFSTVRIVGDHKPERVSGSLTTVTMAELIKEIKLLKVKV